MTKGGCNFFYVRLCKLHKKILGEFLKINTYPHYTCYSETWTGVIGSIYQ